MKKTFLTSLLFIATIQTLLAASVTVPIADGNNVDPGGGAGAGFANVTYTGRITNQHGQELSSGSSVNVGDTLYFQKDSYSDNTQIVYFCPRGPNPGSPYGYWSNNPTSQNGDLFVKPPVTTSGAYGYSPAPTWRCEIDPMCGSPDPRDCEICSWDYSRTDTGNLSCNGQGTECTVTAAGGIMGYFSMAATDFRSNYNVSAQFNNCATDVNGQVGAAGISFELYAEAGAPSVDIYFSFFEKVKSFLREIFS